MNTVEALAAIGGSGVVAVIGYFTAKRRARSNEAIASTIHDERVTPKLLDRIDTLEGRADSAAREIRTRNAEIRTLNRKADDCEAGRKECKEDLVKLGVQLRRVRATQENIQHNIMRSTPPGEWDPGGTGGEDEV